MKQSQQAYGMQFVASNSSRNQYFCNGWHYFLIIPKLNISKTTSHYLEIEVVRYN